MSGRAAVLSAVCAAIAVLAAAPEARAQYDELTVTVDPTTFFEDEAAWLFGTRVALGISNEGDLWPQIGAGLGYVFPSHFYLAGTVDGRLTGPEHVRAGLRLGALFRRRLFNVGFGSSLSVLAIPGTREVGPVATTWIDLSLRLGAGHFLSIFADVDVLVEQLGFDDSRALMSMGVGWTMAF